MLPVQLKKEYRKPGLLLGCLAYATWFAGIGVVISAIFLPAYAVWLFLPIFLSVLIQGFALHAFGEQEDEDDETVSKFDQVCLWVQIGVVGLAFLCFGGLMLVGGGPEMVDGDYCIVNHGEIIRYITPAFFRVMQSVESGFMAGLLYMLSSQMMLLYRSRRRIGARTVER